MDVEVVHQEANLPDANTDFNAKCDSHSYAYTCVVAGPDRVESHSQQQSGTTIIGLVDTPPISAQTSVTATLNWDTAKVPKGSHTLYATADDTDVVAGSNESDNTSAPITVTIQGNRTK